MRLFNKPNDDRVTCPICTDKYYVYLKRQYICPSCIDSLNRHIANVSDILGHHMEMKRFMKVLNNYKKFNYHDRNLAVDFYHICDAVYRDDESTRIRFKELEDQCDHETRQASMYLKLWNKEVKKPVWRKVLDSIPFIRSLKDHKTKKKKGQK